MKYVEARPGLNILKSDISVVEKIDEMTCKIITSVGAYESIYPSWRIMMLLEQPDIEEQIAVDPQTPDRANLWGKQHFAG
jgi:hypothetical protein